MTEEASPKRTLIRGAAWTVGTRWSIKGLGFLNTMIMARLLVPADYGVVAMAMLVVGLIQAIMDFGASTALLRKGEVSTDEIDSAWTLRVIQGFAVSCLLLTASLLAPIYFKEPNVKYVLWVFAICVGLSNISNIGLTLAQKAFNFSLEFRLQVLSKLISVAATVAGGFLFGDYRALVLGVAAGYLSAMMLSYLMHPYRPKWNTKKIGEIWAVTKWLMLAGVAGFILRKGDELIAGRIGSTGGYGMYNVGSDLGQMPTGEVGPAMLRAFLPVLAAMKGGIEEVNSAVIKTASAVNTITLAIGFGFAAVAEPATSLILGPTWAGAAQYVAAFSIVSTLQILLNPFSTLLVMRGHTKSQSQVVWIEFASFLMAASILVPTYSLIGLAYARMVGTTTSMLATTYFIKRHCSIRLTSLVRVILRPLIGVCLMYFVVKQVMAGFDENILKLLLGVISGGVFYTLWTISTWMLVKRPEGLESLVYGEVLKFFNGKK